MWLRAVAVVPVLSAPFSLSQDIQLSVVSPDCRDLCFPPERGCDQVPDELHRVPEEDAFQLQRPGAQR